MTKFGYTGMGEQTDARSLITNAVAAEEAGFDFAVFSDHFHPWLDEQGHSPFVWSVLGAVADRTEQLQLMTMVTCPIIRYHPAIIAQAAATVAILSDGRFTLGLGAGENLNEHVVGHGWPPADVRQEMLDEAVELMLMLWRGGSQTWRGKYFTVQDARLYDLPEQPIPLSIAAGGSDAATLAARVGEGLIATEPKAELVSQYRSAGGSGPTYGQIPVCWAEDESTARKTALQMWRFGVPGWKVMAELPSPVNFESATQTVREDDVAELVACGPDVAKFVDGVKEFVDAGFDHVAIVQAGPDQAGFLRFWEQELKGALTNL